MNVPFTCFNYEFYTIFAEIYVKENVSIMLERAVCSCVCNFELIIKLCHRFVGRERDQCGCRR